MTSPAPRRRLFIWLPLVAAAASLHVVKLFDETGRMSSPPNATTWQRLGAIRFQDEASYYVYCADGIRRDGLPFLKNEDILRSPPAPWLWLLLWGRSITLARFGNIALVLTGALLIARIARHVAGPAAQIAAFVLAACGYQVALFSGTVLSEPLAFFFLCAAASCFFQFAATQDRRWLLLTGLSLGLAACSRAAFQLLPFLLVAVFHARTIRARSLETARWSVKSTAALLAAYLAVVLPWMTLNKINHGVFRLANGFGAVMLLGSDPRSDADEPVFRGMQWQTGPITGPYSHMHTAGDRRLMHAALANIRAAPFTWMKMNVWKIGRVLIGGPQWHFFPFDNYPAAKRHFGRFAARGALFWWTLGGTAITLFGLAGLVIAARRDRAPPHASLLAAFSLTTIGYIVALHAVSYALPRFAVPLQGLLALGCVLFAARRPRIAWTLLLAAAAVGTTLWLAYGRQWFPQHVSSVAPTSGFITDFRAPAVRANAGFRLDCPPTPLPFNATFFVQVRVAAPTSRDAPTPLLSVRPRWANDEVPAGNAEILIGLHPTGTLAYYRFCVELNDAWRGRSLAGLDFALAPPGIDAEIADVVLAH